MKLFSILSINIFTCILLAFVGCTKKQESSMQSSSLLDLLPKETIGLVIWNTESEGFKKFKATPWAESQIPINSLDQPELKTTLNVLNRIGLINTSKETIDSISEGIGFATIETINQITMFNFALYTKARSGEDLTGFVLKIRSELSKEGIVVKDFSKSGREIIGITLNTKMEGYPKQLFISSSKEILAAATSEALLEKPFLLEQVKTTVPFLDSPEFKDASTKAKIKGSFLMASLNLSELVGPMTSIAESIDPKLNLKELPVKFISFDRSFKASLTDSIRFVFDPKTEEQKKIFGFLKASSSVALLKSTPKEILFTIQLDGPTLASISQVELADVPNKSLLEKITRLAIMAKAGTTATLFPEITLVAESSDPKELADTLSNQIKSLIDSGGMPFSPWKETTIEGNKINFSLTPLGIGLYIANINGKLVASSSEDGIKSIIALTKSSDSFYTEASKRDAVILTEVGSVSSGHLDFEKLGDTLKELQGTLAMFSGGAANMDPDVVTKLKKLGKMDFAVTYSDFKLGIETVYN
ncbi:MAG: hypothetical protein SGJ02_11800 [bacterium]|nr:hypothetical protein [bacterium]